MEGAFALLRSEASSKDLRTAIETLITIYRNIHQNPAGEKFRKVRITNANIIEKFWKFEGAQTFMLVTGWRKEGEHMILDFDIDVAEALGFLLENRFVKPSELEWVAETKQIVMNPERERDLELRAEALKKKERDMEELRKDMDERKAIAAAIIAEHRNDLEKRKIHRRVGQTEVLGSPSTALALPAPRPAASAAAARRSVLPAIEASPAPLPSSGYHV